MQLAGAGDIETEDYSAIGEKIPLANIWLLLFYAQIGFTDRLLPNQNIRWENPPRYFCHIVAELLCSEVDGLLRRQLTQNYVRTEAVLTRLRGAVDMLKTERRQLMQQGRIACRYYKFTIDTPRNRFVRAALERAAALLAGFRAELPAGKDQTRRNDSAELARRCIKLSRMLGEMGVRSPAPQANDPALSSFGRHDNADRLMVVLAKFIFNLKLPTEDREIDPGYGIRRAIEKNDRWLPDLFERAVYGFYKFDPEIKHDKWKAEFQKPQNWDIDPTLSSPGVIKQMPLMKLDTRLTHEDSSREIIVETKFKDIYTPASHGENKKFKTQDFYQVFSYIFSQPRETSRFKTEGVLLYPQTESQVDAFFITKGHRFRFITVDLSARDSEEVIKQLRKVVSDPADESNQPVA